jgi:dimethylamine monooxygenase subunit B
MSVEAPAAPAIPTATAPCATTPAYRRPLPLRQGHDLVVRSVRSETPGVRSVALAREDGGPLPEYVPGSHLLVECATPTGTRVNAYSLTGSGSTPDAYPISVLHRADGAGGSAFIHRLVPGETVRASLPRNGFAPTATATHHLLIAGGIGVTPVLSHVRSALRWGRSFTVLYAHRDGAAPHRGLLRTLCGDRLEEVSGRDVLAARLPSLLARQPLGTHLYVCGGTGLTEAVLVTARGLGWPEARLHHEVFDAQALDPGEPFTVRLDRSGTRLEVPSGTSLLDALEDAGLTVPNRCRQGVCGECRIAVTAGTPLHRDGVLTAAERQAKDCLMPCVSRAVGPALGVDL